MGVDNTYESLPATIFRNRRLQFEREDNTLEHRDGEAYGSPLQVNLIVVRSILSATSTLVGQFPRDRRVQHPNISSSE